MFYKNTSRWSMALYRSNQGPTRQLDKSSLTTILEGPSHSYNVRMRSLNNEINQWTMWSCLEKHKLGLANLFHMWSQMRIPNPPQKVLNHSPRKRYAIPFWINDRAT
ncbi:hypothetical protein IC582_004784 [Cucumis melo]